MHPLPYPLLLAVAASAPPVRLRLATASLADTRATCVARTTIAECERVRDVGQDRKMIRRRGLQLHPDGQLQMVRRGLVRGADVYFSN